MTLEEYARVQNEATYLKYVSRMERVLYSMVQSDIDDKGLYLDDEIGGGDYVESVERVVGSMTKTLWDSYGDNINDIILEEIGSDEY